MTDQHPYQPYQPSHGYVPVRDHPKAVTVLVLGILSFALCQLLGPVAWSMGNSVRREIAASGGQLGGQQLATVGWVLGIVSTVLILLALLAVAGTFVLFLAVGSTTL